MITIKQQLQELRTEYKTADNARRKEIKQEGDKLKAQCCYECQEVERLPETDDHFPYCSKECHEKWADKNYVDKRERQTRQLPVHEIQKRLKEMAKESHMDEENNGQKRMIEDQKETGVVLNH